MDTPLTWSDFESQIRQGRTVGSLLQNVPAASRKNETAYEHKMEVKIGENTFDLTPMMPSFKELVQNLDERLELAIPDPAIPIGDLLPLRPSFSEKPPTPKQPKQMKTATTSPSNEH